jgi:hypothetical protein
MGALPGGGMKPNDWTQALSEMADAVVTVFIRFWKQDIVQVGLSIGMFFALALPLILVMLVLWYIDSTGWRPSGGFYKIGLADDSGAAQAALCMVWLKAGWPDLRA